MSNIIISPESGILEFNNNSPSGAAIGSATAPIRLDATGGNSFITGSNFGIGTSEPQFSLDVDGSIHGTSGNFQTAITVGGNPVMTGVSPESDTLQTVTNRGATSTNAISVSNVVTANEFNVGNEGKVKSTSTLGLQLLSSTNKDIIFAPNNGSTERMRIKADGDVGIGTTEPSQTLHVKGIGMIEDASSTSFGTLQFGTNTTRYIRGNSAELQVGATIQQLHFQKTNGPAQVASSAADGVTAIQLLARNVHTSANLLEVVNGNGQTADFVIDSDGKVGIGTITPNEKLEVNGSVRVGNVKIQNANGGRIGLNRNTSTGAIYNNTFGAFQIQNNDTTGFEIQGYNTGGSLTGLISMKQSDGYVGIGIASPTTKFHIDDNATAGTGLLVTGGGVGNPLATFTRDVGGSGSVEISSRDSRPQIKLAASSNTFALGVNGSTFEIADNTALGTNARLSITNTGNVGIGTTSPAAKLDVYSAASFRADVATGNPLISIVNNTATSNTAGTATIKFTQANTQAGGKIVSARDGNYSSGATRTSNLQFYTSTAASDTEKMRIDSSGNVGIGVTPEAWTVFKTSQIGQASAFVGRISLNQTDVATNWYYDGAEKRITTGYAQRYTQTSDGKHEFYTAGTGSADSAITFSKKFEIENGGNATFSGSVTVGGSNILPATNLGSDLGSSSKRFASIFCSGLSASSSVTTPTIQLQSNLKVLNKAQTSYLDLASRDTSGSEVQYNLNYVGHVSLNGELNFTTNSDKYIDVNTIANGNSFNIRHHNPTGNVFKTAFQSAANGATTLYYNGAARFATTTDGIQLYGNGYLDMPDNGRIRLGASYDLAIYHDGSNSYIQDTGSGGLRISSDLFRVYNADLSGLMINAVPDDRVELYFNDNKKLETTSSGITVTGGITLGGTGRIQGIDTVTNSTDAASKGYVDAQVGSADTLQEVTDNGNTTTNSVGVGTSSANGLLQVGKYTVASQGNQGTYGNLSSFANSDTDNIFLGLKNGSYPNRGFAFRTVAVGVNSDFTIYEHGQGSAEVFRITAGGNIGIGTTGPSRKFEIHENTTNLTIGEKNGYAPSVYGPVIETNANAITLPRDLYLAGSQANVRNISSVLTLNGDNGIAFRYYDGSSGQEGMRLTNAGHVGIGTTNPAAKLDVKGGMSAFETTLTNNNDWENSAISILERDNVGSAQSADKYSPNLNFHWSGRVSNSLWMNSSGYLNWGSFGSNGIPNFDGVFQTNTINLIGTGRITGVDTVSSGTDATSKTYVDNAITSGVGSYLPLAGGTMTGNIVLGSNNINFKTGGNSVNPNFFGHRSTTDLDSRASSSEGAWSYTTFDSSTSNAPSSGINNANGLLTFNTHGGNYGHQIAMTSNSQLHVRTRNSGSFGSWRRVFDDTYHPNADTLTTARTINGVSFNGSADITVADSTKLPLSGGTMTGSLTIDGQGSSSDVLKLKGSARIQVENASGNDSFYISNTGGSGASKLDLGGAVSIIEGGNVGIGVTNPSTKLQVGDGTADDVIRVLHSDSSYLNVRGYGLEFNRSVNYIIPTADANKNLRIGYSSLRWNDLEFNASGKFVFNSNTAELVRIKADGDVGIGTAGPTAKLDIVGDGADIFLQSADYKIARIQPRGTGADLDKGLFSLFDGSTEDVRIDTAGNSWFNGGNVGIGQGSPTAKLHLKGDGGSSGLTFKTTDASNNETFFIMDGGRAGVRYHPFSIGIPSTTSVATNAVFQVEEAGLLTVLSTGNVGIGTTSPAAKLDVNGTVNIATHLVTPLIYSGGGSVVFGNTIKVSDALTSTTKTLLEFDANNITNGGGYNIDFRTSSNNTADRYVARIRGIREGDGAKSQLSFWTENSGLFQRMTIKADGNVGIGTTSPSSLLHLEDAVSPALQIKDTTNNVTFKAYAQDSNSHLANTSNHDLFIDTNNTSRITVKADGKVGINTGGTTLYNAFTVQGNANINNGDGAFLTFNNGDANLTVHYDGTTGRDLSFKTWNSTQGNIERMRLDKDGNLGIGTADPNRLLQIKGGHGTTRMRLFYAGSQNDRNAYIDMWASEPGVTYNGSGMGSNINGSPYYGRYVTELGQSYIRFVAGALQLWTGPASSGTASTALQRLTILDGGNVGIGIGNPAYKLHVSGTVGLTNQLYFTNNTAYIQTGSSWGNGVLNFLNGSTTAITFDVPNNRIQNNLGKYLTASSGTGEFGTLDNQSVAIVANNSTKMTILSGGNVGIGTTNPVQKLQVNGSIYSNGGEFYVNDNKGITAVGNLIFKAHNGSSYFEGMRLASTGNVGIGITDPDTELEVEGTIKASTHSDAIVIGSPTTVKWKMGVYGANDLLIRDPSNNTKFSILSGGNVGIGTASPAKKLEVAGDIQAKDSAVLSGATASQGYTFHDFGTGWGYKGVQSPSRLAMFTASAERVTIDSDGNVGIGTTSPEQELHVYQGTTKLESTNGNDLSLQLGRSDNANLWNFNHAGGDLRIYNNGGNGYDILFAVNSGGGVINNKVGIGTANPTEKLHVEGSIELESGFSIASTSGSYWQRIRTEDASASTTNAFNFETRNGSGSFIKHMVIRNDGNVGIGVTNPSYSLQVGGSIVGSSKSFLIKHPTKEGKQLLHACIEGPENGVYFRGKSTSSILEMPDYWIGLVHIDSMTVDITAIGPNQDLYVESIADDGEVTIGSNTEEPLNYFYVIYGERKDIDKLEIEILAPEYAN